MGFSGGGSNVLLPHTHDGTVSQDGGSLNFNNVTQSQSAAGEVFYSDGVHLQQLAYPGVPAGETLTAAALSTAPSWAAAAPVSTVWTELANITLGSAGTLQASGLSHYDNLQVYIRAANVGAQPTGITFNSTTSATSYSSHYFTDFTADEDYSNTSSVYINGSYNTSSWWNIWMNIWNLTGEEKTCSWTAMLDQGTGNQNLGTSVGFAKTTFTTDISSIEKVNLSTGLVTNQQTGSRMVVLGAN